ncbi:MAG: sulfatase, partial [Acidobacteriota bacterium]
MKPALNGILSVLIAGLIFLAACSTARRGESELPNIILITIDALRADHLSCYGYPFPTSPHIDDLARKSIVFEDAFCTVPKTSGSFASLMTGLHPFVHKTRPNADDLEQKYITLAEALKMRGYHNFAVVDNSNLSPKFGFDQGFDQFLGVWDEREDKAASAPFITRTILNFLGSNPDKPFFLWAHYIDPHAPYEPPEEFVEARPPGRNIGKIEKKTVLSMGDRIEAGNSSEGYFISLYDGAIKYIDSEIKKVTDALFAHSFQKNTILILTSDHGEELGEHNLFFDHGQLTFSSSTRVPLIVFVPKEEGRRVKQPVSLMDLYPTLLEKVGLVPPYELQGTNLFVRSRDRFLFIRGGGESYAVVQERFLLVKVDPQLAQELGLKNSYFFDLLADPEGKQDISARRKDLQRLMEEKYREFLERHGD